MIWGIVSTASAAIIFIFLFIRSTINNGKLRAENQGLQKNVDVVQKQLEIAANHKDTPPELAERMRKGTL